MKRSILFSIVMLSSIVMVCQESIQWNFLNDIKDSVFTDHVVVNVSHINNGDSIFFGVIPVKINCSGGNKIRLFLKRIATAVRVKYCNDSIDIPISEDHKIELHKIGAIKLTLKVNKGDPGPDPVVSSTGNTNKMSTNKFNLYYDAYQLYLNKNVSEVRAILDKYQVDTSNKFLDSLFNQTTRSADNSGNLESGTINKTSGIPGLDVTTLADGLAKFLVARVKREMIISFFNHFSTAIRDTSLKDLRKLFKNTSGVLDLMGEKIYDYQPYLASLRQSMEYDYKELPEALNQLINDEDSQLYTYLEKNPNQRFIASIALNLGLAIKEEEHIGKALADLKTEEFALHTDKALLAAIQSLQVFSESLRDTFTGEHQPYWLNKAKINGLVKNDTLLRYFIGLIAQRVKENNIELSTGHSLYTFLNAVIGPTKVSKFDTLFKSLQMVFSKIHEINSLHPADPREDAKEISIINYFDAANDLFESSRHFVNLFQLENVKPVINKLLNMSADINGLIKNVTTKKYTLASMHLSNLVKNFTNDNENHFIKVITFITQKSLFIGQLAEAKTSDEVAAVIESFAAPIGSWRDKRVTSFNVAIDSYVGPAAFFTNDNQRIAVSTPVGLSTTFPLLNYPVTLLWSVIDIGPATAFRFKNDTSEVSRITLGEIFSPGIFTSINFGKSFPLTLNAGYQQYPLLKKVSVQSNDYNEYRKGGLSISFNMNIPILTLFNRRTNDE